ncbi:hypothetical protein ACFL1X_01545, partial [Candidatus Hydrogenedentota bacterium]
MPIEQAIIAQSRSYMRRAKARALLEAEASKGCRREISSKPTALESPHRPVINTMDLFEGPPHPLWVIEPPFAEEDDHEEYVYD